MKIAPQQNFIVPRRINSLAFVDTSDRYVSKLEKHIAKAEEAMKYSSDRFDILIISLATGALVLSLGSASGLLANIPKVDTSLLKFGWLMMIGSILANLVSQISGYFANQKDIEVSNNLIRLKRNKQTIGTQKILEFWCTTYNKATLILNGLSMLLLVTGMVTMVLFYSNNI
ncbi:hypothetical protein OQY15_18255 [Pedobacter sp. MC2016-15]|uniref:hypothetical protein n=1 Tax=Pedobacter sp. MC2016-15 TaxID=2994473 RepID=UPI0022480B6D|nr:hypothetical protein [Pedobacter sp. MC2016-15]MCX2481053.1 hypothetical protein [Pedobacter sp. MC2016-15]